MSEEDVLEVYDRTAVPKSPERTHEVLLPGGVTKSYTFRMGEWLPMPRAHAMQLLRSDAFEIREPGTHARIRPTPKQPERGARVTLEPGTTVAHFDELTADALAIRCNQHPDGRDFHKRSGKDKMIAFLTGLQSPIAEPDAANDSDAGDLVGDEYLPEAFSDAELA